MSILKKIRKIEFVNRPIRKLFKKLRIFNNLSQGLINRWPTSGVVDCEFENLTFKLYNKCDDGLVSFFYYNTKDHESADLQLFIHLSKFSSNIIDIGANTGLFSILAAKVNPQSVIYSFEPYFANSTRMKLNLNLNKISNVNVIEKALGDKNGQIEITVPEDDSITDASSVNNDFSVNLYRQFKWKKISIPLLTLDTFATNLDRNIDLIKCDVETFEMEVFKGGFEVLKHHKPTIICETFLDEERITFFNSILAEFDYYVYFILDQGIVYSREGMVSSNAGLNYLFTPIKPIRSYISFKEENLLAKQLLIRPINNQ